MDKKEKKTSAEQAREERKERIEKAAKTEEKKAEKKAEKQENQTPAKKRAKIIVPCVIIAIALILALCYFFGVPHRMFTAVKLSNGEKVSIAEYEYYYMSMYNNYLNRSYEYEQQYSAYYGPGAGAMMTGFDYTKTPREQEFKLQDTYPIDKKYGKHPTWADFIEQSTVETCQSFASFYDTAKKENFKLSKKGQDEIKAYVEDLRNSAAANNFSLDAYLRETYGRGMTEKLFREILTKQVTVSEFLNAKQQKYLDNVTDKDIMAEYNKNPNEYKKLSLRCFSLQSKVLKDTDKKHTAAEIKEYNEKEVKATTEIMNKFFDEATLENFSELTVKYAPEEQKTYYQGSDAQSSLLGAPYSDVEQYFGKDAAKWAFDKDRKVGDKKIFTEKNKDGSIYTDVLLIKELPVRDDTKQPLDVRHILIATEETKQEVDKDGNPSGTTKKQIRTKEEAKKLAEDILNKWVKDGAKEKDFIELANKKSDDHGSKDNGGLYEGVTKQSNYVKPFLDWCFADGRKVGDYGIVETEYGYHIMYMSKISKTAEWQTQIKETIASNKFNKYYEAIATDKKYSASLNDTFGKRAQNRVEDYATDVILNIKKQAAATAPATTKAPAKETTTAKKADK